MKGNANIVGWRAFYDYTGVDAQLTMELPPPDALKGTTPLWKRSTIDAWKKRVDP